MRELKRFFKNLSIQRKINYAILLTCGTALAVTAVAIFAAQLVTFRHSFTRDLEATGQMIGQTATAAITFTDQKGAREILAAVSAKPHILRAALDLPDGSEFAAFDTLPLAPDVPKGDGSHSVGPYLVLNQPVILAGKRIATLRLVCDYRTEFGRSVRLYAAILGSVLLVSVLLALVLSNRLQRLISGPILSLAGTARTVAEKKDYSLRAPMRFQDEVGELTAAFNQMLSQIQAQDEALARSQLRLMETSRQAGMAQVATDVLHNVGNVLNSVNVSVSVIKERISQSRAGHLTKVSAMLDSHRADLGAFLTTDPKGQRLPEFISHLADALEEERNQTALEMQELEVNVEHIKQIVVMQQSYAKVAGVIEDLSAATLIEDAIRMNEGAFLRHGVTVKREFEPVPPVRVDKHKVLQILINLFRNAKYAMDAAGRNDKVLTLGVTMNGNGRVKLTVRDNGTGIAPEDLTRIFGHGFTTKKDGHGFGLHSGANAAKEMGGSLQAYSEGAGTGATFVLELPTAPATSNNTKGHSHATTT